MTGLDASSYIFIVMIALTLIAVFLRLERDEAIG